MPAQCARSGSGGTANRSNDTNFKRYQRDDPNVEAIIIVTPAAFPFLQKIQVSPTQVTEKVGHDVKIRYDAGAICNGQTIRDANGTIFGQGNGPLGTATWQVGTVQDLPDVFGDLTQRGGYVQAGKYTIMINMNLQMLRHRREVYGTESLQCL